MLNDIIEAVEQQESYKETLVRSYPELSIKEHEQEWCEAWENATRLYGSCFQYIEREGVRGFAQAYRAKNLCAYRRVNKRLR